MDQGGEGSPAEKRIHEGTAGNPAARARLSISVPRGGYALWGQRRVGGHQVVEITGDASSKAMSATSGTLVRLSLIGSGRLLKSVRCGSDSPT